jgi:predicted HNH restriction endonuclease
MCSEDDFACLEFHHIDPKLKEKMISDLLSSHSWERIVTELKKCVVVCRNCHAKIHHYVDFVTEEFLNNNRYDIKYGIPKKPR